MRIILFGLLGVCFGAVTALSAASADLARPDKFTAPTILIGTGCAGPSSVVVGEEESDFPACEQIKRHYLPKRLDSQSDR